MISVTALQQNNKIIYVGLLSTLTVFLLMDYIPVLAPFSRWVTPPVSLFLGLIFDRPILNSIKRFLNICCNIL